MFDCANVEMRELLPELVAGSLDAATRARVEQHVASCAECASELETLRLVRSAFGEAPAINVQRVVAALPKPVAAPARPTLQRTPVKRWMDWRIAAALTTVTIGVLSLAVVRRAHIRADIDPPEPTTAVTTVESQGSKPTVAPLPKPPRGTDSVKRQQPNASAKAMLSFGGGVSDLDDESIRALLGALDEIERSPVAPSAEPDPTPVLPVIKQDER